LELSFVPAFAKATASKPVAEEENSGREIEFFVAGKWTQEQLVL
jgi:hypothetical protein